MKREMAALLSASLVACALGVHSQDDKTQTRTIKVGDLERTYLLHVPGSVFKDKPAPLVFLFHGGGSMAHHMVKFTGFNDLADKEGFIVVYPEGIDKSWNDGREAEEVKAQKRNIDDVGFVKAMVESLSKEFSIDPKRIYASGISNGGFMSERLAAEMSDTFAAIGVVAAGMGRQIFDGLKPKEPVSVLILNGTDDPIVPYHGGAVLRTRGKTVDTDLIVQMWAQIDGCGEKPSVEELPDVDPKDGTRVKRTTYSKGKNGTEVVLYSIEGGGHTWPGGNQYLPERVIGKVCRDVEATPILWQFFKAHPKP
jgi:polyhydroxybutyrate depolymerase